MADASACIPPGINIAEFTGPLTIGYQLNWALYGILTVQVYIYLEAGLKDSRLTKSVVYGLYALETLQIIVATHDSFNELAYGWGNFAKLTELYLTWLSIPLLTGITSAMTQCFYTWRIYVLSRSKPLAILIVLIALVQASAAITEAILGLKLGNAPETPEKTFKTVAVWLGGTALCDVLIASIMVYFLSRRRTAFKRTNTVLSRLTRLIVETGMATAAVAIVDLAMFLKFQHNFFHIAPALILSKLYSNSVLVLLNSRVAFTHLDHYSGDASAANMRTMQSGDFRSEVNTAIHVDINRETLVGTDGANGAFKMTPLQSRQQQAGRSSFSKEDMSV